MIQLQVLNKVLLDGSMSVLVNNGVTAKYFSQYQDEYKFIENHNKNYGKVPDDLTILEEFPGFKLLDVREPDNYLIDAIREEYLYNEIIPIMNEAASMISIDSKQAVQYLIPKMQELLLNDTFIGGKDIAESAMERYEWSKRISETEGLLGQPTGLEELDEVSGGWLPGEDLVVVVGRPNAGKSWWLNKFLTEAWRQNGATVLLYSGEMNELQVGARMDTLLANISNRAITRGEVKDLDGYKEHITEIVESGTKFIVVTPKMLGNKRMTMTMLDSLIQKHKPDIVGIDQLSLMEDEEANKHDQIRVRYGNLSRGLLETSEKHSIPIILAAQAKRSSGDKAIDIPDIDDIAESDMVGQYATRVLGVSYEDGIASLGLPKNRYGVNNVIFQYFWDIDTGAISYAGDGSDLDDDDGYHSRDDKENKRVVNVKIKTASRRTQINNANKDGIDAF